jgi:hypothetical protein
MITREASCSCGKLSISARGEPVRISVCHCLACQKRTGSAFGVQARYPLESVSINGTSGEYQRTGDSGGTAWFHFCKECGSTVYWRLDQLPGFVAIAVGAFADPGFPPPKISVYNIRRHPWVDLPDSMEHLD